MKPDLTDENITASCEVAGTTFARFGISGWYWWNGVTWGVLPSPLHIEPMLDAIVARDAEIERLRAENERLQGLIDAHAAAHAVVMRDDLHATVAELRLTVETHRAPLAAARNEEDDR